VPAVSREADACDVGLVTRNRPDVRARGSDPDADRLVGGGGGDQAAVWGKGDGADGAGVALEDLRVKWFRHGGRRRRAVKSTGETEGLCSGSLRREQEEWCRSSEGEVGRFGRFGATTLCEDVDVCV